MCFSDDGRVPHPRKGDFENYHSDPQVLRYISRSAFAEITWSVRFGLGVRRVWEGAGGQGQLEGRRSGHGLGRRRWIIWYGFSIESCWFTESRKVRFVAKVHHLTSRGGGLHGLTDGRGGSCGISSGHGRLRSRLRPRITRCARNERSSGKGHGHGRGGARHRHGADGRRARRAALRGDRDVACRGRVRRGRGDAGEPRAAAPGGGGLAPTPSPRPPPNYSQG
mmetsp:Transcript_6652/g.16945  ORF Transcript_6652/g.16945 Transcript_6652/m.16945 type:complete len:223 (+) Transcript_6652:864-1532(+)